MKSIPRIATVALCAASIFVTAGAQSKQEEKTTSSDEHQSLAERIGSVVEDVVARLERGFSGRSEDDAYRVERRDFLDDSLVTGGKDSSLTYEGDTVIHSRETVNCNVVVKGGDLTVFGRINGDVLVVGGNLHAKDGSYIGGNVKVINGDVFREDDAVVVGYIDRSSSKKEKAYRAEEKNFRRSSTKLNAGWANETTNLDNFIFRYNRVEGLFLGLGSNKRYYWDDQRSYSLFGSIGYGLRSQRGRGNLGLSRQFAFDDGQLIELEGEVHSLTDTKDDWLITVHENTAAAILIHEDFRDYFHRYGFGVNLGYALQQDYLTAQVRVGYAADEYRSMDNRTEWSLFGGDKQFRLNPAINEGLMRGMTASAGLSTVSSTIDGPEGWSILTTAELTGKGYGGDFEFNRFVADIRRFQPLGRWDNLNVRFRVGTSEGVLPLQKTYEIGGLGTLQGFPFKEEMGNRMLLMNAEFIVNGDFLGDLSFWPSWLMKGINLLFLSDAGLVRQVGGSEQWSSGFEKIKFNEFKHDVGVGIATRNGSFRMAFVWRTDRSEPPRFIFRFARPF